MVQAIIQVLIVGLLTGLAGIIWMIVRDIVQDNHSSNDNQLGNTPSPEPLNGEKPHEPSSKESKVAA